MHITQNKNDEYLDVLHFYYFQCHCYYTGVVVGLESEIYSVKEGDVAIEVCALIKAHYCPLNFSFIVLVSTESSTAGYVFCVNTARNYLNCLSLIQSLH